MNKPGIGKPDLTLTWATRITECVEVLMGRRDRKVRKMVGTATKAASSPTQAEFNAVVEDLRQHAARFNELLEQVQD